MEIPPEAEEMPIGAANAYLRRHPVQKQWSMLTISHDEWLEVRAVSARTADGNVARELDGFGLRRLALHTAS